MFTEGLDRNALRWVREKQVPISNTALRSRNDPISGMKSGVGRGFGLPPPSKFRSGHLPANAIPVSTAMPGETGDSASNSDNDDSIGSEGEVYGGRYSLDSSPQDRRVPNGAARKFGNFNQRESRYGSDYTYSEVSSSRETLVGRPGTVRDPLMRGPANVRQSGFTEDDSSDSAASSEFSTTQVGGSINGALPRSRTYLSEGYASSVPSRMNVKSAAEKHRRISDDEDDDIPSAPPFSGSTQDVRQTHEEIPTSRAHISPNKAESRTLKSMSGDRIENHVESGSPDQFVRIATGSEAATSSNSHPPRLPTFHASALGPWHGVIAYDACVRLCLHAWAMQCMEAPMFLENECALLRDSFGLRQILLQSEDELMVKSNAEPSSEGIAPKPKKLIGKMKVQVRKVKMGLDPPTGCSMSSIMTNKIKMDSVRNHFSNLQSSLSAGWQALRRIQFVPRLPANGSLARHSLAYVQASTRYMQQVSGLLKVGVTTLRNNSSSYEVVQETYSCFLRLKSIVEDDAIKLQPGSSEVHMFFPDSLGDDLLVEVQDSKGKHFGRVLVQVATIADDPADKLRWWPIYREPDHELVGKLQLYINYSTSADDNSHLKYGSVAETVAYDLVMEVAMKIQGFQQRNLLLHGPWKWLLTEFASYYGVSEIYTKLRYLSYVMDVATPTADCLNLVCNLLAPVTMKGNGKTSLSHQENRILGETKDQIEQVLTLVFENYKSLDESSFSGIIEVFRPATGHAAPALEPAVKLYKLLHDILSPEAQTAFCHYFQVAAKKRSKRHLSETDEYIAQNNESSLMDGIAMSTAYQKMKTLCINLRNEIYTDIQKHSDLRRNKMGDNDSLSQFLASAVDAAQKAGEIIRKGFYQTKNVQHKGQVDLVTETDKACEDLIFNHLKQLYPSHKFIGEETTAAGGNAELTDEPTWIVDPLDGTTNFVHGFPFVCVSIGLTIGKIPTVGVVYNPIINELFTGIRGKGAFLNGKPIKVSSQTELMSALLATEIGTKRDNLTVDVCTNRINSLLFKVRSLRMTGSCALNLCGIACGRLDVFFELGFGGPWDVAGGAVIVREAGGVIFDPSGADFDITSQRVAASNPFLKDALVDVVRQNL